MDHRDTTLSPNERAKALLAQMSPEEKLGQLVGYLPWMNIRGKWMPEMPAQKVGQVSALQMRTLKNTEDAIAFQQNMQQTIIDRSAHNIPAVFHMEGLCGAYLPGATSFPSGIGRGSGWDPELEQQIGQIVGRQERAMGITYTLAPVLDLSRDARMGRHGEAYGEDPTLAAALGSAYVKGVQQRDESGRQTDAVAKHFLGFHLGASGIHGADSQISPRELREIHAKPFQAAITEAGIKGIMPCYCSLNGEPVSVSKEIMTDLLREEMGFDGVVFSDYGGISNAFSFHHIGESLTDTGYRAMEAGMDLELPSPAGYNLELLQRFENGEADIAVLDAAVERVLTAKFRMGLFEHPMALAGDVLQQQLHHDGDEEVSLRSARQSLVLLKNDGTLPLSNGKQKIAVIGYQASTARIFFGGYTHFSMAEGQLAAIASMAGVRDMGVASPVKMETLPGVPIQSDFDPAFEAVLQQQKPGIHSLLEELRIRMPQAEIRYAKGYNIAGNDHSAFEEALQIAKDADIVILTLGGKHGTSSIASMGEGVDATDINLPECQDAFMELLEPLHKKVIGIHFNGRPISSDVADRVCGTILEAWNPAEKGAQAIADVLLGEVNPSGKMPVSVAYNAGQIPIYYNHPNGSSWHQGDSIGFPNYVDCTHKPRYPFGHGLSYTEFTYSNLHLNAAEVAPDQDVVIHVDVQNTGNREGTEVVQLYIRDEKASMTRPNMELAGFCRVSLLPGEAKAVTFTMKPSQLAFLDRSFRWKVEKGLFTIKVGASSEDIRLTGSFRITEDAFIDGKTRGFYAKTVIE